MIGINSISEICGVYKEAKSIFERAAMNLREWNSNCFEFLELLRSQQQVTVLMFWDCRGTSLKIESASLDLIE